MFETPNTIINYIPKYKENILSLIDIALTSEKNTYIYLTYNLLLKDFFVCSGII